MMSRVFGRNMMKQWPCSAIRPIGITAPAAFPSIVTSCKIASGASLSYRTHSTSPTFARVQASAPTFTAPAVHKKEFITYSSTFHQESGRWLVLFFYPLDFTFVCPTEIIAFSERIAEFEKIGTDVVGVSVDSKHSHLAWMNTPRREGGIGDINYPLVSDITKTISQKYGVLASEDSEDAGLALRGTFIIDPKGILRHMSVNDLAVGRNVDEIIRLVEGYQFSDEHGQVCPATWKKSGDKTMVADPEKSKEYFAKVN